MRLLTCLSATLLIVLGAAPVALAADVAAQPTGGWIKVKDAGTEANRLTLSHDAGVVTVRDDGADLTAGDGCTQVTAREVRCAVAVGERARVDVALGAGDDVARVLGALPARLDGGPGDDVLTGGDADDVLLGGGGADRLDGGAGADEYDGGAGDDTFIARDGVREPIACGDGTDTGEADLEDDVAADCEGVVRPLAPPGLDDVQPAGAAAPDAGAQPSPVAGRSAAAAVSEGTVRVRVPGAATYVPLDPTRPVPVGTVVDARRGKVTVTTASDLAGGTQTADFTGARFRILQRHAVTMTTELRMVGGDFSRCRRARASGAVAHAARVRPVRRLWGSGKGRFRTRGRSSSATVRGTVWTVADRCDGTLTRVQRGVVVVKNVRTGRTKVVRAGQAVLVRRRAARR